ncbi:unnamed protein product [Ceutorhynchus assimilis]|uniref:Uncharacterized protein n=1 Tax=Ceutorhynchus assimilis TaxID=467358 RepID=A0A9P0DI08_9CUCU|nr:unnamed protein product [Ceutorhynchus assimilis]
MKNYCWCFSIIIVCSGVVLGASVGGITVGGAKCGQITCKQTQYCSSFDNTCQECDLVCNTKSHNYEEAVCEKQCQDYLHDIRYARKDGSSNDDLRSTVDRLSQMVTITLTLTILMLLILAGVLCFQLYRWKIKKNISLKDISNSFFKKNETTATTPDNRENKKRDMCLEMPGSNVNSEHSPVTVTTSIDRRPAEDSTLDYSYDNPVMRHTNIS